MSDAQSGAFCLRLSDGRSLDLPIGTTLSSSDLPGLHSIPPGGPVARVTTHPTDPSSYGFQNLSHLAWRVRLPDGKKVEIAPGKNVRLVVGTRIRFGVVDGEVTLGGGGQRFADKRLLIWAGGGGAAALCLLLILVAWRHTGPPKPPKGATASSSPLPSAAPHVLTGKEIAKASQPSVVTVIMLKDPKRNEVSQGSGFIVARNLVITNFHVIDGTLSGVVKFVGKNTIYDVKVLAVDHDNDLALLRIDGPQVPALELAPEDPDVGDDVYVVGSPKGFEATFSRGNVSGFRKVKNGERLQITAPISHGSSGGPVLNADGKVIGVSVAIIEDGSSQNINFAIPVKYIRQLLK